MAIHSSATRKINEVARIINSSPDSVERVRRMKDYFNTFRDDLLTKDVLPEYLAYVIEHVTQGIAVDLRAVCNN